MNKILVLCIPLMVASCATKHSPSALPHIKIPRANIVAEATNVRHAADDMANSNGKIKAQLEKAVSKGDSVMGSSRELEAEFARLVSKEAITRSELAVANQMLKNFSHEVEVQQKEVINTRDVVNEQAEIIKTLLLKTTNMLVEAATTEQKLDASTRQSEAYASKNQELFDERDKHLTSIANQAAQIGRLRAFAIWGWGLILIYILWRLVKLYLRLRV